MINVTEFVKETGMEKEKLEGTLLKAEKKLQPFVQSSLKVWKG